MEIKSFIFESIIKMSEFIKNEPFESRIPEHLELFESKGSFRIKKNSLIHRFFQSMPPGLENEIWADFWNQKSSFRITNVLLEWKRIVLIQIYSFMYNNDVVR